MADDKKEYKTLIKLMDVTQSVSTTINKLSELAVDAQDEETRKSATKIAKFLRSRSDPGSTSKMHIQHLAGVLSKSTRDPDHKAQGETLLAIRAYAQAQIDAGMPQWQILALRAGWTPPAPSSDL